MSTDAKRDANARYLAKQKSFVVRMSPDLFEQLRQTAEKKGVSINSFFVKSAIDFVEKEKQA